MTEEINNPWTDWLQQATLDPVAAKLPLRMNFMRARHGKDDAHKCGACTKLRRFHYHTKTYNKCQAYGITHGAATDWRMSWPACGLFEDRGGPAKEERA